jgi:hypothetical protein
VKYIDGTWIAHPLQTIGAPCTQCPRHGDPMHATAWVGRRPPPTALRPEASMRRIVRVRGEIMGPGNYENVGKSQSVLAAHPVEHREGGATSWHDLAGGNEGARRLRRPAQCDVGAGDARPRLIVHDDGSADHIGGRGRVEQLRAVVPGTDHQAGRARGDCGHTAQ